jgi:lipoic acid synthetase
MESDAVGTKRTRLPDWIRIRIKSGKDKDEVRQMLSDLELNTVCESAKCPNLSECWHKRTATFMIMGNLCTRECAFCGVEHSDKPLPPSKDEAQRIVAAITKMGLKHAVITSVTRDDLPDGGASCFSAVTCEIRRFAPSVSVEILVPDFGGNLNSLEAAVNPPPDVFNHNVETVERLTPLIRSGADYKRSIGILSNVSRLSKGKIKVKSGIMLGLGEEKSEIEKTIREIREAGTQMLTIGQYLMPSQKKIPVRKFIRPEEFEDWKNFSLELGFESVASGPLVRSSYMAEEQLCRQP